MQDLLSMKTRTSGLVLAVALVWACSGTKFVGVSDDAGDLDAGADGGGGEGGRDANTSCYQVTLPGSGDNCGQDFDCTFGAHQTDCCGNIRYIGYNVNFKTQFDN